MIQVEGLKEFRSALKTAIGKAPRVLTNAIKTAGVPLQEAARDRAPKRSGDLAAGYAVRASGTYGRLINKQPYAMGAEWGVRGKWSGFQKYGPRGDRIGYPALRESADDIERILTRELTEILTVRGWFRGSL